MTKPTLWQGIRCIAVCLALQVFPWALELCV